MSSSWTFQEAEAVGGSEVVSFNSRAEICILRSQTYSFSTAPHFWLYLPRAEMTVDLEANEVEVKMLTSLASVTGSTGGETGEGLAEPMGFLAGFADSEIRKPSALWDLGSPYTI